MTDRIEPRDYQAAAVGAAMAEMRAGSRALIVSPGGSGKTVMIALAARRALQNRGRVLVFSHRRELVRQAFDHFPRLGIPRSRVTMLLADSPEQYDATRPLCVASHQTMWSRGILPPADLVIIDEAHHAASYTYDVTASAYPHAMHLGLTATPARLDGRGLGDHYDVMIEAASPSELIEAGHLAKPRAFLAPKAMLPNLGDVRRVMRDFHKQQLNERVNRATLVGGIVDHYQKHAAGRTAVAFCVSVEHARRVAARFNLAGVPAEAVHGRTDNGERDRILQSMATGETKVLANCMILSEGWDLPSCQAVILARPTLSAPLFLQQCARGMRPHGNERPIILDHASNYLAHGMPEADRDWSLHETKQHPGSNSNPEPPVRVCDFCGALMFAASHTCPECDATMPDRVDPEEQRRIALEELTRKRALEKAERLRRMLVKSGKPVDEKWIAQCVERSTAVASC